MNHRAKCDTASFILGGEIRNRTNTKKTNRKKEPIYPHLTYRHVWITTRMQQMQHDYKAHQATGLYDPDHVPFNG